MSRAGNSNRSNTNALNKVTEINRPTVNVGGLEENTILKKPKNRITEVMMMAFPVSIMVVLVADTGSIPFWRHNLYRVRK